MSATSAIYNERRLNPVSAQPDYPLGFQPINIIDHWGLRIMLDNCDIKERWSGVNELIERWLAERQSLIVQFCAISGIHEFSPQGVANKNRLQKFCQLLLDYASAGHFEVFYQLLREAEAFQDGSAEAAKAVLPKINATTSAALDFNDRYVDATSTGPGTLAKDLSRLGEILAARFDFEDQLIAVTHFAHREQVA